MTKLEAALELASRGFKVFPLRENTKEAILKDFPKLATTDSITIEGWFRGKNHNIGILTNDLLVIDVDVKDPKKNGLETIQKLMEEGKEFPPTLQQTTPTQGIHLIYKPPLPVGNTIGKLGPGLDTRGTNGYIVGSGSTIDGLFYKINGHSIEVSPPWLNDSLSISADDKPRAHEVAAIVPPEKAVARGIKYLNSLEPVGAGERNGAAFKAAAKLKDIGVSRIDMFDLLLEHWQCEPMLENTELKHVIRSAFAYGKEAQGSDSPEAAFLSLEIPENGENHPVININKEYAFIMIKGDNYVLFESTDHKDNFKVDYMSLTAFHNKNAANLVSINNKMIPATQLWLKDSRRRSYEGVVFSPEKEVDPRFYNLWRGFGVQDLAPGEEPTAAMKRAVTHWEEHIFLNACGGDAKLFTWVKSWFAHIVQKPWEKPGTALVLKGKKGVGKNVIVECMKPLLHNNYTVASNSRYLVGQFNSHLENLILFVADEAFWGGDKAGEGVLKGLITDESLMIERKGIEPYIVESCVRVAILGNEDWIVPSSEEERRYAVFEMGEGRKQDRKFFSQLMKDMRNGGDRYLFHTLKNFDISGVDVGVIPMTKGLHEQKIRSLSSDKDWWFQSLSQGYINGASDFDPFWVTEIDKDTFMSCFYTHADNRGISRYKLSESSFFKTIFDVCPSAKLVSKSNNSVELRLPELKLARAEWDKFIGHSQTWGYDRGD